MITPNTLYCSTESAIHGLYCGKREAPTHHPVALLIIPMASQVSHKRAPESPTIPDRLYFKIGDVARICGLETYVLRFWESQFPQLKPNKSGTGQRLYRRREVELVPARRSNRSIAGQLRRSPSLNSNPGRNSSKLLRRACPR
jgi:hypothetical protein